jgi:hypothetical protein
MTVQQLWSDIAHDTMLHAMLILIVVDIVLGVAASVKAREFTFARVAGFAETDLLGKVLPWATLYAAWKFAPSADVIGVDFEAITRAGGAIVIAALVGSLTSSLNDLGLKIPLPSFNRGETG